MNSYTGGSLYFGVNIDGRDIKDFAFDKYDYELAVVTMGIQSFGIGSGDFEDTKSGLKVPISKCEIDWGDGSVMQTFGINEW